MRIQASTRWLILGTATALFFFLLLLLGHPAWAHPRASPLGFFLEHLRLVAVSSGLTLLVGLPIGILATRPRWRPFWPVVSDLTSVAQTFPPVAVLALAVPVLGLGFRPAVAALFLYGMLPVIQNTATGFRNVPADAIDAANGMGMSAVQSLWKIETPLAMPLILEGVRISVIINIGTATIGAVIGAGGLGSPITAGLAESNLTYVLEGAVPAAVLAIVADQFFATALSGLAWRKARS